MRIDSNVVCVCFCDGRLARRKVKNVQKGIYYWSIQAASLVPSPFLSRATHFRRRTLERERRQEEIVAAIFGFGRRPIILARIDTETGYLHQEAGWRDA